MPGRIGARKAGAVGWVEFDNPDRFNAIDLAMWKALPVAMEAFDADPEVRVIAVTGAGSKAFTTGADISEFAAHRDSETQREDYNATADASRRVFKTTAKPTVAVIRGYCLGGGIALALDCDFRIAAADARFGVTIAKLGAAYRVDDLRSLIAAVGPASAREILMTGSTFTGEEARALGLATKVAAPEELDAFAGAFIDRLAGNAPLSMAATKRTIAELMKPPGEQDFAAAEAAIEKCLTSADATEGRDAFMQKRKPVFGGA
ncbi:MAG: enoyl-CoA hydratase [Caulobacteraceae bacterium]